jgi:hypothetical protein
MWLATEHRGDEVTATADVVPLYVPSSASTGLGVFLFDDSSLIENVASQEDGERVGRYLIAEGGPATFVDHFCPDHPAESYYACRVCQVGD